MYRYSKALLGAVVLACSTGVACAQESSGASLLAMPKHQMRQEVEQRYQAALKLTLDPAVINNRGDVYTWASEAKVACGIAIGFLKTGTVDADSVTKCDEFARRMSMPPPPPPPPPPPAPPPVKSAACYPEKPLVVYFDWNADAPKAEAQDVISQVAQNYAMCGWAGLNVVGHADRSGPDDYNLRLSQRRAKSVADSLVGAGVPAAGLTLDAKGENDPAVPTPDGVREPLNRRVDISPVTHQ
jgi:OmpA-OmpF porin, OOP family